MGEEIGPNGRRDCVSLARVEGGMVYLSGDGALQSEVEMKFGRELVWGDAKCWREKT